MERLGHGSTGLDLAIPRRERGNADAPLVEGALPRAELAVVGDDSGLRAAVVAREDEERLLPGGVLDELDRFSRDEVRGVAIVAALLVVAVPVEAAVAVVGEVVERAVVVAV